MICTTGETHIKFSLIAAEFGSNLFIEKPLSNYIQDTKKLEKIIKRKNIFCHIGSNMRFHFGPETIKKILSKNILGKIIFCNFWGGMYLPNWHPKEDYKKMYSAKKSKAGGVILDFIHEIDLAYWFFGMPKNVASISNKTGLLKIGTHDVADVIMCYKNGVHANIHLDYLQQPPQRGIRLVGSKGWAEWNLYKKKIEIYLYKNKKLNRIKHPKSWIHNSMYLKQNKYILSKIRNNNQSSSNFVTGKNVMILAKRISSSSNEKKFK